MTNASLETLLNRAAAESTTTEHGFAFELISDYALRRSPEFGHEIASIERYERWAARTGQALVEDTGVDRVITTTGGELWAVQNKGYAQGRHVDHSDMSRFMLTAMSVGKFSRYILVTSGPGLTKKAAQVIDDLAQPVVVLDRSWLEQAANYPSTLDELKAPARPKGPFRLRTHQRDALTNLRIQLLQHDDIQFISACGTGKTVTTHALAKRLRAETVAFFVPSLGLMRQTIRAWRRQAGRAGIDAIAVCSDNTVGHGDDEVLMSAQDLNIEVIRDPERVAAFLAKPGKRMKVVFCTYHSEDIVVRAQKTYGAPEFELAIADEAHYLVGQQQDQNKIGELFKRKNDGIQRLAAAQRVYATATPRVLSNHVRDELAAVGLTGDSMGEGSAVFGPIAHHLSFRDAIDKRILSDYSVQVVAVPDEVTRNIVNQRLYIDDGTGKTIDAQTLAALEAVKQAYAGGARRIVTYHSRKADAVRFAELVNQLGMPLAADSIWGGVPAAQRDAILARLERPEGYLISNVRCLNEGVDMPRLDAVVFVDPKSSPIDVAQSIGRVLRRARGKQHGRVILPIPVASATWESGDIPTSSLDGIADEKSAWGRILGILSAMAVYDEVLEEELNNLRMGRGKRSDLNDDKTFRLASSGGGDSAGDVAPEGDGPETPGFESLDLAGPAAPIFEGANVYLVADGLDDAVRRRLASSIRLATAFSSRRRMSDRERVLAVATQLAGLSQERAELLLQKVA